MNNALALFAAIVVLGLVSIYVFRLKRRTPERGRIASIERGAKPAESLQEPVPVADELVAEELHELVSLDAHVSAAGEVLLSDVLRVVTSQKQWAYAVWFPLRKSRARSVGRVLIRVTGWVSSGKIGVGLVRGDRSGYVQEVFRTPQDGITTFDLVSDSVADCWAVVVRNAGGQGVASTVVIQAIHTYRILRQPESESASA